MLVKLPKNGPLDEWVKASQIDMLGFDETDDGKFWPMIQMFGADRASHLTFVPMSIDNARKVVDRIAEAANGQ